MEWVFDRYRLNAHRAELLGPDGPIHIERTPFKVLIFLIENADRVVTKDDLVEGVWNGRIVSDSTISTAIKQVRRAIGDSGNEQTILRTIHGRGFRFVAEFSPADTLPATPKEVQQGPLHAAKSSDHGAGRPSIAVLKFTQIGDETSRVNLDRALPAEIISGLSRAHSMDVIARASSFQFDPESSSPKTVGEQLNVRYLMTGLVEVVADDLIISLDIVSTATGTIIWSDRYSSTILEIQSARRHIVANTISILEVIIPQFEAMESHRLDKNNLDAWSHFHLGLSLIYRFNSKDNQTAARHFQLALDIDPRFSRAHSGLSFTHWQNAFMHFGQDRNIMVEQAIAAADAAIEIDSVDPFANFNMGRALWIKGDIDGAHAWLDRASDVNPNYAQCHYNKGLILMLDGVAAEATELATKAYSLSPLDPLAYGMHSVRALTHITTDQFDEACQYAKLAMQSPGTHYHISMIAAAAAELSGDKDLAILWRDKGISQRPNFKTTDFFSAFPFRDKELRSKMVGALDRLGLAN